jgi:hypothetical protein
VAAQKGNRRGSSRSRRGQRSAILPWVLIGGSALAVVAAMGATYWFRTTRVVLDSATMCPVNGPTAVHAVLVDRSDVITPLQAQRIRQVFDRVVEEAGVGERIDVYVLTEDGTQALSPRVSMCRPKSEGNDLYENSAKLHESYVARFKKPLEDTLAPVMAPATEPTSPIMESVKAVCVAAFGALQPGAVARLTIASDMIQFSPVLNHYKQRDFEKFETTPAYREVLADCHHAQVDVLYLTRPRDVRVQDRRHQLFWERFFDHENAVLLSMEAI